MSFPHETSARPDLEMRRRIRPHRAPQTIGSRFQISDEFEVHRRQTRPHQQKGFLPPAQRRDAAGAQCGRNSTASGIKTDRDHHAAGGEWWPCASTAVFHVFLVRQAEVFLGHDVVEHRAAGGPCGSPQPIIAAPMPLVMWSWLRLRQLRRNDAGRTDFGTASRPAASAVVSGPSV